MYVYKRVFVILVHTCGVRGICHLDGVRGICRPGAYMSGEGYMSSWCIHVGLGVYVILVHTCGVRGICHLGAYMWG